MTISNITPRTEAVGNGSQYIFNVAWMIFSHTEVKVYVNGVLKTLNTDYTLSGDPVLGAAEGAVQITFVSPPANGAVLLFLRETERERERDVSIGGQLISDIENREENRLVAITQEQDVKIARKIGLDDTVTGVSNVGVSKGNPYELLSWNATATGIESRPVIDVGALTNATTADFGVTRYATDGEAQAMSLTTRTITASNLAALTPTETRPGLGEIATDAEVATGTDDVRTVTPKKLATALGNASAGDPLFRFMYFGGN